MQGPTERWGRGAEAGDGVAGRGRWRCSGGGGAAQGAVALLRGRWRCSGGGGAAQGAVVLERAGWRVRADMGFAIRRCRYPVRNARPYSTATKTSSQRYPTTREAYSRMPPTIAPSRLAPKAVAESPVSRKRWAKTMLARKTGAKAMITARTKRGSGDRDSSDDGGTAQATISAASRAAYSRAGRRTTRCRDTSTAANTDTRTPAVTRALTNQVVPNSSANWTMFLVSSSRKAAPMKNRSTYPLIRRYGPAAGRTSRSEASRIRPRVIR